MMQLLAGRKRFLRISILDRGDASSSTSNRVPEKLLVCSS
jgi:hypothetical protein